MRKVRRAFLLLSLGIVVYFTIASVRLSRMCEFWDYYNCPELKYGSQITFAELVRFALWLERAPSYSWSPCINGLRRIDGATQQWALDKGKADDDKPTWEDLKPYFGYADNSHPLPYCPKGGRYILRTVKRGPKCTVRGHALPE